MAESIAILCGQYWKYKIKTKNLQYETIKKYQIRLLLQVILRNWQAVYCFLSHPVISVHTAALSSWFLRLQMRGFRAGGTTEYRTDRARSRDGEEMEGGFKLAKNPVLTNRKTTAR